MLNGQRLHQSANLAKRLHRSGRLQSLSRTSVTPHPFTYYHLPSTTSPLPRHEATSSLPRNLSCYIMDGATPATSPPTAAAPAPTPPDGAAALLPALTPPPVAAVAMTPEGRARSRYNHEVALIKRKLLQDNTSRRNALKASLEAKEKRAVDTAHMEIATLLLHAQKHCEQPALSSKRKADIHIKWLHSVRLTDDEWSLKAQDPPIPVLTTEEAHSQAVTHVDKRRREQST